MSSKATFSITINHKDLKAICHFGTVIEANKENRSDVVTRESRNGIRVDTIHHDRTSLWVKWDDGTETELAAKHSVSARPGHRLAIVEFQSDRGKIWDAMRLNLSTNEWTQTSFGALGYLIKSQHHGIAFLIAIIGGIITWSLTLDPPDAPGADGPIMVTFLSAFATFFYFVVAKRLFSIPISLSGRKAKAWARKLPENIGKLPQAELPSTA